MSLSSSDPIDISKNPQICIFFIEKAGAVGGRGDGGTEFSKRLVFAAQLLMRVDLR